MDAIKSATLEIIRLAVFAAISAFTASVTQTLTNIEPNTATITLLVILRFIDKWVHKNKNLAARGILPF